MTSSKFQSLTRSLLTAQLRTSRGVSVIPPLVGIMFGQGVTLDDEDDDAIEEFGIRGGRDAFLIKQLVMEEHLPSFSELEMEQLLKE